MKTLALRSNARVLVFALTATLALVGVSFGLSDRAEAVTYNQTPPQQSKPKSTGSKQQASNKKKVNPNNFNKCKIGKRVKPPANNKLGRLNDYFANDNIQEQPVKDHLYMLGRDDGAMAKFGYCYQDSPGYAFNNQATVNGVATVPLYHYVNAAQKHFYTINPSADAGIINGGGYVAAPDPVVAAYIAPQKIYGTKPIYRYHNGFTGGYYFTTKINQPLNEGNGKKKLSDYGYSLDTSIPEGIAGYVWGGYKTPVDPAIKKAQIEKKKAAKKAAAAKKKAEAQKKKAAKKAAAAKKKAEKKAAAEKKKAERKKQQEQRKKSQGDDTIIIGE